MTSRQVELITIGDELLLGFTIDTNAAHISRVLAARGIEVVRRSTVGDQAGAIAAAVREALDRTGAVITTGGLGPTSDDLTKSAIAGIFGREMTLDEGIAADLERRWRARFPERPYPRSNRTQAEVPAGAKILANRHGTAPGIWLEANDRWVAMLPGVPREMRGMLEEELLPAIESWAGDAAGTVVLSGTLRTTGIAESAIADLLGPDFLTGSTREDSLPIAYLPGLGGVDLRVTARGLPRDRAEKLVSAALTRLRERVGAYVYGEGESDLAAVVLDICRSRKLTIAVAESCTGGMMGERLTSVPGSSDVFLGGVIAYHNDVKRTALGVRQEALDRSGAVSEEVALQMAAGVSERMGADIGISLTGVAGPGGGSPEKPVGLVWVGLHRKDTKARRFHLIGDRAEIRQRATQAALEMVRRDLGPG